MPSKIPTQLTIMNRSEAMEKAGPYYGPQGGKYEDPQHKIPWKDKGATPAGEAKKVKAAVGKLFPGMFVGVDIGDRGYQLEFAPTAPDAGPLARIQTDGRVAFTVAPRGLKPWPDGVAAVATDSQTKEQLKLMGIKAPRKTSTTADKAGQALVRWFEKNAAVLRRGKGEEFKKADLRTSPVLHVIQRWPGQVPDRRGLEANLLLRKVNAWSTPRPDPQVTQIVPTAQHAVSNLGLDYRTEGEWVRFLENVVYPNVPEIKVRQAVLEKMMSDRMDPALRSVLWSRVAALVKHVRRGDERMEKAAGHKYKRRWRGHDGQWHYEYDEPKLIVHNEVPVRLHPKIHGGEGGHEKMKFYVTDRKQGKVRVSRHDNPDSGVWMPKESLPHFQADLAGEVEGPPSKNPDIQAVLDGKGEFLGKGDDGLAFKVGDKVVKVSTTVPYQPENPGHRSPKQAVDMLRKQSELGNKLVDLGVKGVQRSEFVEHGGKGYQIKSFVELPKKFTREQLDAIQDIVIAIHKAGYTVNDTIQPGLENGKPVLFDVGKAAPSRGKHDIESDMDNLAMLYRDHGQTMVRKDLPKEQQYWEKTIKVMVPKLLNEGKFDTAQKFLNLAAKGQRKIAEAQNPLELQMFENDLEDTQFEIDFAREQAGEETKKSLMHVVADLLEKAQRGGKYIRRVPYTDKHGKTKYRYFYKESAAARSAQAGEEIKLGSKVAKVIAVQKNGDVTIAWDGNKQTFAADSWHRELSKHYGEAFEKSAEKRARQTINAVLRHVPSHLLEDLKGETDEQRLEELKTRVPAVYDKLQRAFQRAGMGPFQAKQILTKTLERRGWEPEARAAAVGTVLTRRGTPITLLIDTAENLAGGAKVEARHVAAATELGAAGKGEPLSEIKNIAAQAERDVAKLASMLAGLQEGKGTAAELFAEALASKALQKLNMLSQAFPGLADRAVQPARQIVNEVAAETPRKPTREGAETVVYVAGEGGKPKALKARYRLVEAEELIASHKPDTFAQREDYPAGVQERAYHRDKSEQAKVIRNAQRMDPRFVVNTNPDAVNGPPMATSEGIVLGGNSRAMSMQRIYSHHPDKAAEMREYLEAHAHEVGFKPEDIAALKNPVLIREVEVPDQSKRNLQVLVRQMNESFTQGMDPRTMQVAMGRRLDADTLKTLATDMQEDETLASFLGSKRSERFVNALHRAGIIDDRNANQYTIKGTRMLNQDGVQLVSRILVGRTVEDADILSNTGPQMIESVARAVPALTQATAHGEGYDIGPDLAVAISAFNDLNQKVAQGVIRNLDAKMPAKDFRDLFNHFRTLPGIAEPHPVLQNERATMLLELLIRRRGPTMMAKFSRDYAAEAAKHPEGQATMFGTAKSPTEVLADAINRSLGKPPTGPGQGELMAASFVMVPEGDDILGKSYVIVNGQIRRLVG